MVTVIRAWRTAGLLLSPLPPLSMSSSLLPASPSSAWQRKGDQEGGKEKDDHEAAIPRDHPWLWGKCPPKPLGSATTAASDSGVQSQHLCPNPELPLLVPVMLWGPESRASSALPPSADSGRRRVINERH